MINAISYFDNSKEINRVHEKLSGFLDNLMST